MPYKRTVVNDSEPSRDHKDIEFSSVPHSTNEVVFADESSDVIQLDTLNNEPYATENTESNSRDRRAQRHNNDDDAASSPDEELPAEKRQPIGKKRRVEIASVEENFAKFLTDMRELTANKSTEPSFFVQLLEEKMNLLPHNERMKMEISFLSQINAKLAAKDAHDPKM